MSALVEFGHTESTWQRHNFIDGTNRPCFGRIFRLAYPFGWQHIYCDANCCDHPRGRDPETGEEIGGRHHVKCLTDYTFTEFYYCLDCGRVGVRAKEDIQDYTQMQIFEARPR